MLLKIKGRSPLEKIDQTLKRKKLTPKDIEGLQVQTDPQSFTTSRIICAVANTLAWALKVKVNGKDQVLPTYE
jgi:tRNA A37 threonylcarbamoyladenosine modification protein TsaB